MTSLVYKSLNTEETEKIGERLARTLFEKKINRAFIAMRGEMGVGKTAFSRGFCRFFGIKGVKSPTYTVVNEYRGMVRIFHYDMYRITSEDDLISTGYDDYCEADGFVIAEWSENIEELIPYDAIFVTIERDVEDESYRNIKIDFRGEFEAL
jgi:tRNA threonylcarbamoyladenosine biosynthesis protein TsaE